jgi:hypothetical protein
MRLSRLFRLELLNGPPWPLGAAGLTVLQPVLHKGCRSGSPGMTAEQCHSRRFELASVTSAMAPIIRHFVAELAWRHPEVFGSIDTADATYSAAATARLLGFTDAANRHS